MRPTPIALLLASTCIASSAQWYEEMQIGPAWYNTFQDEFHGSSRVAALKGLLIDVSGGNASAEGPKVLFDTETLRMVSAWEGGIKWGGTPWTGDHGALVTLLNQDALVKTAAGPGWADSKGSFEDQREIEGYGNLDHAKFLGHYRHGSDIAVEYSVGDTTVLESFEINDGTVVRSMQVGTRPSALTFLVADEDGEFTVADDRMSAKSDKGLQVKVSEGLKLAVSPGNKGRLIARIGNGDDTATAQISMARGSNPATVELPDFAAFKKGGEALHAQELTTEGKTGKETEGSPYVTDTVTIPESNPWKSNLRFGGFDFLSEDTAVLSTWNGDVWTVSGLEGELGTLKWRRIASGLFETLGLKVVNGNIYVNGRDQITQLIDLNDDGEIDQYKVFNRDVIITENFHEFAFDLQTDQDGNFYFSKASPVRGGGRGFDKILPHNGIVARIGPDGEGFEVIATGLRAPGGLGIGPNGELTTGENEGTWQPCCKINLTNVNTPTFFGTEPSRHGLTDAPYTPPLAYLPMDVDNSGGSQIWVPEGVDFGVKPGEMLHLSYGQSSVFRVLQDQANPTQGGVVKLPINLSSSAMRARFHDDGSMFVVGFRGWQTNAATECSFHRVRYIEDSIVPVPNAVEYTAHGIRLTFEAPLDQELAEDPGSYSAERWDYVRGPQYGSGQFSVDHPDAEAREQALEKESQNHQVRDTIEITGAKLSSDGKTVEIGLAGMKPSMQLKVSYDVETTDGDLLQGDYVGTVYELP